MQRLKVHRCAQHFLQIRPRARTGTRIEKCRAHLCTVHSLKYAPQKKRYNLYPLAIGCLFRYHIVTTPLPPRTSSLLLNIYGIYVLVDTFVHFPSHSSFVIFIGKVENNRTNLGNPLEVTVKKCIIYALFCLKNAFFLKIFGHNAGYRPNIYRHNCTFEDTDLAL